ncbi:MAG: response regulator [Rhodospirillales bacterium]|nr:response regulator [Acetobacter sp.]
MGWWLNIPAARHIVPGQPPVVIPTAVAILLLGSSLLLTTRSSLSSAPCRSSDCCAVLASLIGVGGLIQPALPDQLDEWVHQLLSRPLEPGSGVAVATGACITLTAVGLLLQGRRASWLRRTASLSTLSGLFIAVIGILGYVYEVGYLHEHGPFFRMSFLTALCLTALCLSSSLSRPERPWVAAVISRDEGGALVRRLLPTVLFGPAILGWLELHAVRAGLVTTETGTAALVLGLALGLAWLTVWAAQIANRRAAARRRLQYTLRHMNEKLEKRVAERTAELDRVQAALVHAQKMEAVGQLTGGLAHDFNNLLTGIAGSLELLDTRIAQGRIKDVERYVIAAQGAAKRAAALTHRLLAFSRQQTLDPKPTDVNRLVAGMEELIRRTMGPAIVVQTVAAGGLWNTLVDPGQLENALLNLCINARDAMPEGGNLVIETGNKWLDTRAAAERDVPSGWYVTLCVSDNGIGMLPEVIARAFDPFFTTKPVGQGTGLGLSMIYGFVRQSGGQVRITSEVGHGTMMCLYLPRHHGAAEEAEQPADLAEAPRAERGETVLVVDDEPTVRMLVTEVLEELGYTAIEAADGAVGLQIMQSDVRLDLLVTDVGLPGGMNGRQLADAGRVARPELKVLFITGFAENALLSHGHLDPGMHVLTKPFTMEALASRIRELITGGQDGS